jgi:hypothetical protein
MCYSIYACIPFGVRTRREVIPTETEPERETAATLRRCQPLFFLLRLPLSLVRLQKRPRPHAARSSEITLRGGEKEIGLSCLLHSGKPRMCSWYFISTVITSAQWELTYAFVCIAKCESAATIHSPLVSHKASKSSIWHLWQIKNRAKCILPSLKRLQSCPFAMTFDVGCSK